MTTVDVARMAEAQAREAMGEVETMATKAAAKVGTIRDIMRGHPGKREAMRYLSRIVNGHCMVEDVPLEHRGGCPAGPRTHPGPHANGWPTWSSSAPDGATVVAVRERG